MMEIMIQDKTKSVKNITFIVGIIVLLTVWLKHFVQHKNSYISVKYYEYMRGNKYPAKLLLDDFPYGPKAMFIFSIQKSCKTCIASQLKTIRDVSINNAEFRDRVIIIAQNTTSYYYLKRYKKILDLENQIFAYKNDIDIDFFNSLELPVFIILNKDDVIDKAWKAEVEKNNTSMKIIENSLRIK